MKMTDFIKSYPEVIDGFRWGTGLGLFQSTTWIMVFEGSPRFKNWMCLSIWKSDNCILIFPFSVCTDHSLKLVPNRFSDYTDAIGRCAQDEGADVAEALIGFARAEKVNFATRTLYPNGNFHRIVRSLVHKAPLSELVIRRHFQIQLDRLAKEEIWGRTLKKQRKRLLNSGCNFETLTGQQISQRIPTFVDLHKKRWIVDGIESNLCCTELTGFVERLVGSTVNVVMYVIQDSDGALISARIGFFDGEVYYDFLTATDPNHWRRSAGMVLLAEIINDLRRTEGVAVVDFMRGEERYKEKLSNRQVIGLECRFRGYSG